MLAAAFTNLVVNRDSRLDFNDLRGSSWANDDPHFQSGFNVVRRYLAGLVKSRFFEEVVCLRIAHRFGRILSAQSPVEEKAWL